jgi:hypothetical protein
MSLRIFVYTSDSLLEENLIFKVHPPSISPDVTGCLVEISVNILGVLKGIMGTLLPWRISPSQTPHPLAWNRKRGPRARFRQQTAWVMAR